MDLHKEGVYRDGRLVDDIKLVKLYLKFTVIKYQVLPFFKVTVFSKLCEARKKDFESLNST